LALILCFSYYLLTNYSFLGFVEMFFKKFYEIVEFKVSIFTFEFLAVIIYFYHILPIFY